MSSQSAAGYAPHVPAPVVVSTAAAAKHAATPEEQLRYARQIIEMESRALEALAGRLDASFCRAVDLIYRCAGSVLVSGMGKAGLIGQKIAATLASTGSRSHFLHPAEAIHGDLGRIHRDDCILMLSQSGDTEEVVRLLPSIKQINTPLVAITGRTASKLGRAANIVIDIGPSARSVLAGFGPQHQHHGNAGRR